MDNNLDNSYGSTNRDELRTDRSAPDLYRDTSGPLLSNEEEKIPKTKRENGKQSKVKKMLMRKGKNKTELKEFTKEEVAKHNTKNDCYIIFNKMVFDVTDWQYLHPGGAEIMGKYGGTDCTADFKKQHPWINPLSLMGDKEIGYLK